MNRDHLAGNLLQSLMYTAHFDCILTCGCVVADEGPETGEDSDEDLVRSYLPGEGGPAIPAINITLHSPSTNHVLGRSACSRV